MKFLSNLSAVALIGTSLSVGTAAHAKTGIFSPFMKKAEPVMLKAPETYGRNDNRAIVAPGANSHFTPVAEVQSFGRNDNRTLFPSHAVLHDSMPNSGNKDVMPASHVNQPASED